uniref:Uncharacterized protein n=1 Tax=Oryza meridionalis TaxID=40149 RepID=A0A0E0C439_9ORYZ
MDERDAGDEPVLHDAVMVARRCRIVQCLMPLPRHMPPRTVPQASPAWELQPHVAASAGTSTLPAASGLSLHCHR